ncbi:hypothetical protein JVU11DRAFT_9323 [Chiua virens]|nr:hypothetical protein JVU11DRAFT_9323 [Chiua virens]
MSKRGRKSKTKAKFAESSRLNQSGKPVESQIGVAAEQPMHPAEIQRMLQLERLGPTLDDRDDPNIAGIYYPSAPQPGPSGDPGPSRDHSLHAANVLQPPYSFGNPNVQTSSAAASSSRIHGIHPTSVVHGYSNSSQYHPEFPPDLNYAPLAITRPRPNLAGMQIPSLDLDGTRMHGSYVISTRSTPYPPIGISPRPGEVRQGERFSISAGQSVIRSVGQGTRVTRNISRVRLPPVTRPPSPVEAATNTNQPENTAATTRHALTPATIESIRTGARSNFKRTLFADTLLPDSTKLATMIRDALFSAAVQHLGDGVSNWLEKDAVTESKKLKDVANNIRNDFKYAARLLVPQLHGLTLPINIRSQEAMFRQQRVATVLTHAQVDGSAAVVPFGHPAVVQIILHVLWKDNYATYLPDNTNIDAVVTFAGTVVRWVLQDHSNVSVSQSEFNTREHLPIHVQLVQRLNTLQGSELERYRELTSDIYARGQEMIGLAL